MPTPVPPRRLTPLVVAMVIVIAAPLTLSAAHRFDDVPDSNVFHDDIAWLADAGVTRGCNPPTNDEFCPSDSVTREQMAAFMHRLAEGRIVDAATAQDAMKLGGKDPSHYETVVALLHLSRFAGTDLGITVPDGPIEGPSLDITVPAAGIVVVQNSSSWDNGTYTIVSWTELDAATPCEPPLAEDVLPGSVGVAHSSTSLDWGANTVGQTSFPVDEPGTHTITVCYEGNDVTDAGLDIDHSIVATWYPAANVTVASAGQATGIAAEPSEGGMLGH